MNRKLPIPIVLICLICVFFVACSSEKATDDRFFVVSEDGKIGASPSYLNLMPEKVVIPSKVFGVAITGIQDFGFEGCNSIKEVKIPSTVEEIGYNPFANCLSLTSIDVDSKNKNYFSQDGILKEKGTSFIVSYPCGRQESIFDLYSYALPGSFVGSRLDCIVIHKSVFSPSAEEYHDSTDNLLSYAFVRDENQWFRYNSGAYDYYVYISHEEMMNVGPTIIISKDFGEIESVYGIVAEKLIIEDGVTAIGDYAFEDSNCCYLSIPGSVESIGESAFEDFDELSYLELGNGIKHIEEGAFYGLESLESVEIPGSVEVIGEYAFEDCTSLINLILGEGIKSIGKGAFMDCDSLESVEIPGSVEVIGEYAFEDCSNLTNVILHEGTESLGSGVFNGCPIWNTVLLPNSLKEIYGDTFSVGTNLKVNPSNEHISFDSGVLIDEDNGLLLKNLNRNLKTYVIPESVVEIGNYAFYGCDYLTKVTITDNVRIIGKSAFEYCDSLNTLIMGNNVSFIGENAFCGAYIKGEIFIPKTVTEIGEDAFVNCFKLESFRVDKENEHYSSEDGILFNKEKTVLMYCPSELKLSSYSIPESVERIEYMAFRATSISSIIIPDSVIEIESHAFWGNNSDLESVTIGKGVSRIGGGAFGANRNLRTINFNGTIEEWNNITKETSYGDVWNEDVPATYVNCTDGYIRL